MKRNKTYSLKISFAAGIVLLLSSCKKLIEVTPPSSIISSSKVYAADASAIAAVTNMYSNLSKANLPGGGITSLNLFPSISGDEFALYGTTANNSILYYYRNALTSSTLNSPDFWSVLYQAVYTTNDAIEQLNISTSLTSTVKNQLLGEVKFMRAFCYFYLLNLYGDVPLVLTTDYKANSLVKRTAKADVYKQVITDLKEAKSLLSSNFLDASLLSATSERVRPTRWAATALLARTYLYTNNFADAITQATTVIYNTSLFSLPSLSSVFLKNSNEAIWQLQPVVAGENTKDALTYVIPSNGPDAYNHPFYLSNQLLGNIESGDQRKVYWMNSVTVSGNTYIYPYKYKSATYGAPVTEYEMVLRLGEQYLIRAEAEAQLGQFNEAENDLNAIRNRAGLSGTTATDKPSLVNAILHERQVELFSEWGHRWFDLKRTGNVDAVMSNVTPAKGGTWSTNWQWYPISKNELLLNPNLVQNSGY